LREKQSDKISYYRIEYTFVHAGKYNM